MRVDRWEYTVLSFDFDDGTNVDELNALGLWSPDDQVVSDGLLRFYYEHYTGLE